MGTRSISRIFWTKLFILCLLLPILITPVFSAHNASVEIVDVSPGYINSTTGMSYVKGNQQATFVFKVTNEDGAGINKIIITYDTSFTNVENIQCPTSNWSSYTVTNNVVCYCDPDFGCTDVISSCSNGTVKFNVTSPKPSSDTTYDWTVKTKDTSGDYDTEGDDLVQTTVDVTPPTTQAVGVPDRWVNSDVTITLACNDGGIGSGCNKTYYCIYNQGESACTPDIEGNEVEITCPQDSVCQKIVQYYSVDYVGNSEDINKTDVIKIDKIAPVTTADIGDPNYGTNPVYITSSTQITLTATDDEGSGVQVTYYRIDDGENQTYSGPFNLSEEGYHNITYWSVDNATNQEETKTLPVFVDNTGPTIGNITIVPSYKSDGTLYISGTSDIYAEVTDEGSGVASCEYTLDGGSNWASATYDSQNHLCKAENIDTSSATLIKFRAIDYLGNSNESSAVKVTPDTQAPTISISGNSSNWVNTNQTALISCEDGDEESGCNLSTLGYKLYDSDPGTCPDSASEYTLGNSVEISSHKWVCAYGEDNVGNSATAGPVEFKVDKMVPTISDDYLYDGIWVNSNQTVNLTPSDEGGSGIKEVRYCEGENCNVSNGSVLSPPYQLTFSEERIKVIRYRAWDNASNPSPIGNFTVKIDKTPPIVNVLGAPSGWTNETQIASVSCQDGISGCNQSSYKLYITTSEIIECPTDPAEYNLSSPQNITKHSWICAYAEDNAGNYNFSDSPVEFKVDQIPPTANLTGAPEDWQSTNATISLTYSDAGGSGIANTYLDVVPYDQTCIPSTPYTGGTINISQHSTACWKVVDNAGNEVTGSAEIKIDKIEPTTEIISPEEGSWHNSDFEVNISDYDEGDSGLDKCYYRVLANNSGRWEYTTGEGSNEWIERPCNSTVTLTVGSNSLCKYEGEDACKLQVKAIDKAGNDNWHIPWNSISFSIDWTPPTVSITSPTQHQVIVGNTLSVQSSASDNIDTELECSYKIDSDNESLIDCTGGDINISGLSEGHHTLYIYAYDDAGNRGNVSVDFIVNNDGILTVDDDEENNPDFTSIQDAINAASPGDIIKVADGTYYEQLIINKSIILITEGNNVILDFSDYSGYGIKIIADGVTIDGFKIIGVPVGASGEDWYTKKDSNIDPTILVEANNILVQNCIFNNASGIPAKEAMLVNGGYKNITFDSNVVNNYIWGVTGRGTTKPPYQGTDNLTVRNNIFNIAHIRNDSVGVNNHTEIIGAAVQLWYGENIKVINNDFNGPGKFDESLADEDLINVYAYADFIALFEDMYGINLTGIVDIQNNTVDNFYLGFGFFAKGGTVQGNKISNCLIGMQLGQNSPEYASAGTNDLDINNNEITNNKLGIWAQNIGPDIAVHFNDIYGNEEYGILNNDTDTLNAEYNYWGCAEGPENESCDAVSENVDYDPWLKASKDSPSVRENGAPTGYVNKTTLTLSLTTDRPATCRYSEEEGKDYDSMEGMFNTSDGLYHYTELSNLTEGNHTYYVRCKSEIDGMPANSDDYVISFTVDLTSPQIVERSPGINAVGIDPATNVTVKFSENVTCSLGSWENCISISSEESNVSGDVTYQDRTLIFDPKDPLKSNTEFTVNLTGITDLAGNGLEGITGWSFITATYYSIELTPGWNLISIPVVPENTSIEAVLGDAEGKIEGVWTYDAVNEEWYVYHPNNSTTSNLNIMIPGYGYWIKAKENATIKGYGSLFKEREVPPQRILVPGWNLIGYYQKPGEEEAPVYCALSTLMKYECVSINIENSDEYRCVINILEKYWASLVTYDNYKKEFEPPIPLNGTMEPGKGYWIFMMSSEIDNYLYGPGETCE